SALHPAADDTDADALDGKLTLPQIDLNGSVVVILCNELQPDLAAAPCQSLDRHILIDPRHHDVTIAGFAGLVHREQVAVVDACLDHAVTLDREQEVGAGLEEVGRDIAVVVDGFHRQDRTACGHSTDDGQALLLAGGQADATRGAGYHLNGLLPLQRAQVFLGGVGGLEAHFPGDLRTGGGETGFLQVILDIRENLRLTWRKVDHCAAPVEEGEVEINCKYIQLSAADKAFGYGLLLCTARICDNPASFADPLLEEPARYGRHISPPERRPRERRAGARCPDARSTGPRPAGR